MILKHLSLTNFRSYLRLDTDIPRRILLLSGGNAQGKTTLLESLFYCASFSSPLSAADRQLLHFNVLEDPVAVARMIVVEYPEDDSVEDSPKKTYKVINPEIIWRSEETVEGDEGGLSIPGYVGTVTRNESIKVKGLSVFGRPLKISASGWLARIFQHEIDHLEGICYIDRATAIYRPSEETEASGAEGNTADGTAEIPAESASQEASAADTQDKVTN